MVRLNAFVSLRNPVAGRCVVLGVVGVLLAAGAPAAQASADRRLELGAQDDRVFLSDTDSLSRTHAFARMRDLGMTWLRINVIWARVNGRQAVRATAPKRVSYDWRALDRAIAEARRHGVRVHLTLMGPAPAWATGDHRVGTYLPSAPAFERFAMAVARHFRGRVARYSIWNEPNHGLFLTPQLDGSRPVSPGIYRELYRAAWAGIKRVFPRARILLGETCPCGTTSGTVAPDVFLRTLVCGGTGPSARSCAPLLAHGFAHHPYQAPHPPERSVNRYKLGIGSLPYLTQLLDGYGGTGALVTPSGNPLPVYLTEFGYQSSGPVALPGPTRARFLPRAFEIAYRNTRVRQVVQYQLVSSGSPEWDTAILAADGRPGMEFASLRAWARRRGLVPRRGDSVAAPTGGTSAP